MPAGGTVSLKGAPIGKIAVVFMPDGKGQIAQGTTDAQGNFKLQTQEPGDGAMVGSYKVAFQFVPDEIPDMPGFAGGKKAPASPIPAKYSDAGTSGITAKVESSASKNVFKFDLQ